MATGLDEIACGCAELTLRDFFAFVKANPSKGFEAILSETGAGQACTACLLDLEHHYVSAFQRLPGRAAPADATARRMRSRSVKRAIYDFVDRLAPPVALRFRDVAPVLYGAGVTEWLWVSNHSMMFERQVAAPPFRLDMVLRDRNGRVIAHSREKLAPGEVLRRDLSAPLAAVDSLSAQDLRIGWLELIRRGTRPGLRGTTRPQFEIEAAKGTCAVHTQAATPAMSSGLSLRLRPGQDRTFLSVLNPTDRPLDFRLRIAAMALQEPVARDVRVAARGAELVELLLPEGAAAGDDGALADVTWSADRTFKVHILYATPNLDQFSVDHA